MNVDEIGNYSFLKMALTKELITTDLSNLGWYPIYQLLIMDIFSEIAIQCIYIQ